jgi:hypothetical protein
MAGHQRPPEVLLAATVNQRVAEVVKGRLSRRSRIKVYSEAAGGSAYSTVSHAHQCKDDDKPEGKGWFDRTQAGHKAARGGRSTNAKRVRLAPAATQTTKRLLDAAICVGSACVAHVLLAAR